MYLPKYTGEDEYCTGAEKKFDATPEYAVHWNTN